MIQYKKILITLALLLTAVTGAWAQSSFGVVEFEVPADWETAQSNVTAADLPGFKASTSDEVNAWGAPAEGYAVLFYAFDGEKASYVFFTEGSPMPSAPTPYTKKTVFSNSKSGVKYYYTTELTEWELTSKDGKNWILDKMPANNIELQVEYFAESNLFLGKEALANKANISVLNGETAVEFDAEGKSTATVTEGNTVTAKFTGTKKVLGMTVAKYVPPVATVTTAPTATAALIEANSTSALVNAGAANGGTMMYAVTTTNVQPASTADFSATRPTAEGRAAGTYYVWFYAKADADHSDSEIAGSVSVTLAVMTTITWNSTNVFNSANQNDWIGAWQSGSLTYEGITISKLGEGLSSFYPYDGVEQRGRLSCFGEPGDDDSYTFTAPAGKKFCKIEIIDNVGITFDEYGDWTWPEGNKIVWSGTAASTVTLGTVYTVALNLNSIVFKLVDAE